jgi:hypothetical protein
MPDISMCNNDKCKRNLECYRFMAVPNQFRQSMAYFNHVDCHAFMPIQGRSIRSLNIDEQEPQERKWLTRPNIATSKEPS